MTQKTVHPVLGITSQMHRQLIERLLSARSKALKQVSAVSKAEFVKSSACGRHVLSEGGCGFKCGTSVSMCTNAVEVTTQSVAENA